MSRARTAQAALEAEKKRLEKRKYLLSNRWNLINDQVRARAAQMGTIRQRMDELETEIQKRDQALALFEVVDFDADEPSS